MSTNVGSIHYDLNLNTNKFDVASNSVKSKISGLGTSLQSIGDKMQSAGRSMTLGVTLPATIMGGALIKSAADLQKTAKSFDVLVGNGKKASQLFAEIKKFADQTPFEFPELAKASTTLLGYGVSVDDVRRRLGQLGDAAAASGGDLNGITLAYAQMIGRGKVTGDNLRQLTENMVTLRSELSQVSGIPMKDLDKAIESGKISTDMLNKALDLATSKGGKFFGGTQELAKTFSGRLSTLKDNILEVGRNLLGVKVDDKMGLTVQPGGVFDRLSNLLPKIADAAEKVGKAFENLSPKTQNLLLAVAGIAIALGPILVVMGTLASSVGALATAFMNPVFWIVVGVLAAIAAVAIIVAKNWDTIKAALQPVINFFKYIWGFLQANLLPLLKIMWTFLATQFKKAWDDIRLAFENLKKSLAPFMPQLTMLAKIIGVVVFAAIVGFIGIIVALIAGFARLIGFIAKTIAWFAQLASSAYKSVKSIASSVINALAGAGSWLYNAGRSIIQGLVNGIKSKFTEAVNTVKNGLSRIRNLLPFSPAKEGPFSGKGWTLYSGMSIMQGFADGIRKNADMPQMALDKALTATMPMNINANIPTNMTPQQSTTNNNIYGNITLGDQSAVDKFFDRLNRNNELARKGMSYGV